MVERHSAGHGRAALSPPPLAQPIRDAIATAGPASDGPSRLIQHSKFSGPPWPPRHRPSVGLYIHGGTCPILQASRHQWQAGRPTQHSTGTFLAVVCELYRTAFSSTFGTLTDFYSGIISSALSTEPVKCANLALENNFLFSLNYPLLSCGALR
ncbi:unnamed protein product [Nesidiocoris tenuis]|uniref:Uncharacterized protein n=1 Tax=Nesidiocoris tenuis TaxID=355587 RepID=A0A6H5HC65_9HEMI|nr:unnamed protein product [Nesidiocoris tenuis]